MVTRAILCLGSGAVLDGLRAPLAAADWEIHAAPDLLRARRLLEVHACRVGLLLCPGGDDTEMRPLARFVSTNQRLEWVGCFDAEMLRRPVVRDLILGHLFDHHTCPVEVPKLLACLGHAHGRALLQLEAEASVRAADAEEPILGHSEAILQLMTQVRRVAAAEAPVLVQGESGTGKELVARSLHRRSARAEGPFVAINCGAIQPNLIHSELFGHDKGAFTGAIAEKRGLFEVADGGMVFLDEIGDLPIGLQANLLRLLEQGTIDRVGSSRSLKVDVRVIAATHVDLEQAVAAGRFRQDLFYRLNVLRLLVPPLRERRDDIALLAHAFFRRFEAEKRPGLKGFSREALAALEAYPWPGNVRELCNRVRSAMIMAEGRLIAADDLGLQPGPALEPRHGLEEARHHAERVAIAASLQRTGRNVSGAARQLGVSRMTLYRLMLKHGIELPR